MVQLKMRRPIIDKAYHDQTQNTYKIKNKKVNLIVMNVLRF